MSVIAPFEVAMLLLFCEAVRTPFVEIVTAPPAVVVVPEITRPIFAAVVVSDTGAPAAVSVAFRLTEMDVALLEAS